MALVSGMKDEHVIIYLLVALLFGCYFRKCIMEYVETVRRGALDVFDFASGLVGMVGYEGMSAFSGTQFSNDYIYQRVPNLNQVYSPSYNLSTKMSTLSMPQNCVRNIQQVDFSKFNADKNNLANYHPSIGYDTRNVINDNCMTNLDSRNLGGECNLTTPSPYSPTGSGVSLKSVAVAEEAGRGDSASLTRQSKWNSEVNAPVNALMGRTSHSVLSVA